MKFRSRYVRRHSWQGVRFERALCNRYVLGFFTIDVFTPKLSARLNDVVDETRNAANKDGA